MSGDVTPPAQGVTPVVVQLKMVGKLLTAIAEVPNGNFFALRVMGGGTVAGTSNSTFVVPTKNCTAQVYSNDMVPYGNPTTTYNVSIAGAGPKTYVIVGFTDGASGPGLFVVNGSQSQSQFEVGGDGDGGEDLSGSVTA